MACNYIYQTPLHLQYRHLVQIRTQGKVLKMCGYQITANSNSQIYQRRDFVIFMIPRCLHNFELSFCCSIFNFIKSLSSFPQFLIHHQKFFYTRVFLWVFSNQKDDVLHRNSAWASNLHCLLCLQ